MSEWIVNSKSCPYLPPVSEPIAAAEMKRFGSDRGELFYEGALECAQSLWLKGLPAQAVLQLNRAFSADLSGREMILCKWELPYRAMKWILEERPVDQFIGNPRRHFQHLATRMVEPRREIRTWRAWACWWYACEIFSEFPADEKQIAEEGIIEPDIDQIGRNLEASGHGGESEMWLATITRPAQGH